MRTFLAALVVVLATGCASASSVEDAPIVTGGAIVGGVASNEQPGIGVYEIGDGNMCTATLVATRRGQPGRVAITAAHCVDFGSTESPGQHGQVVFNGREGVAVAMFKSYGAIEGAEDIALLRLPDGASSAVPPLELMMNEPSVDDPIERFGFGCTSRGGGLGVGTKQKVVYKYGDVTDGGCPGDSGGPLLDVRFSRRIFAVHSGHGAQGDVFAPVWPRYTELWLQIENWSSP